MKPSLYPHFHFIEGIGDDGEILTFDVIRVDLHKNYRNSLILEHFATCLIINVNISPSSPILKQFVSEPNVRIALAVVSSTDNFLSV
jgi:hypothetical protein